MRDGLNEGLPSDRFQVDWWINTKRVERRLSRNFRPNLTLDHYRKAAATLLLGKSGIKSVLFPPDIFNSYEGTLLLVEIPSDFQTMKTIDLPLAREWRDYTRRVFENAFDAGYLITDFVLDQGHSYYVLTHEDSTIQDDETKSLSESDTS